MREPLPHDILFVQGRHDGDALRMPAGQQTQQHLLGGHVDADEGLVQHHHLRILQDQLGKAHPLEFSTRQCTDEPPGVAPQPHLVERFGHPAGPLAPQAAKGPAAMPQARGHQILHGDGKLPVGLADLRQVGHAAAALVRQLHLTIQQREPLADEQLQEGGFAGPVGADHGQHVTGVNLQLQMVHGRMPVVTDRDVGQRNEARRLRRHGGMQTGYGRVHCSAQPMTSHREAMSSTDSSRRMPTLHQRAESCGRAGAEGVS